MIAADTDAPELPLAHPADPEVELRAAYASVPLRRRVRRSFEEAMRIPTLATCIRNLAHARRTKGARR